VSRVSNVVSERIEEVEEQEVIVLEESEEEKG